MYRRAVVTAVLLIALPAVILGLKCYSCQSSGETDPRCEKNPQDIVSCDVKYCTIRRREFLDPPGRIISFYRTCEERPLYTNKVVNSGNTRTYYRACQSDLCNSSDGTEGSSTGGGDGWLDGNQVGGGGGGGGIITAPGMGAAPRMTAAWALWIVIGAIFTRMLL